MPSCTRRCKCGIKSAANCAGSELEEDSFEESEGVAKKTTKKATKTAEKTTKKATKTAME